jgi:regulation of enolase protein 1 (concanavalin A-like superfamily)
MSTVAMAQSPPATFSSNVSNGSETVTVDFTQHPIRSGNFQVLVQDSSGTFTTHTPAASRIYFGTVQDHPGAIAAGLLKSSGTLICRIYFESGVEWSSTGGTASVRGSTNWTPAWPTTLVPAGGAGATVYVAELGIDASNDQYVAANSNVDDTVEISEFSVMASNLAYLRDAAILHKIGKVVVRTGLAADPYEPHGGDTGLLLDEVRDQWNNVIPVGSTHDLSLVAKPGSNGGLAWVGVVGTASRYSANDAEGNGDFSIIWRHEAGHNWGSNHYEGGGNPEGSTIMSNNSLSRFSSSELAKIIAHRNTKTGILDNLGSYTLPLPPRANMDRATFTVGSSATLDVLANDSDSNGQAIDILSFTSPTALGGTVTLSSGTGPGGRDQLIYTPPAGLTSGTDTFSYRIQDSAGNTATGYAAVKPLFNDELAAHWTLNDGSGTTARETTSSQNHGTVAGGAGWATGRIGGAVTLDGTDDHVAAAALDLDTNTMTISGWVKRNGAQAQWAGLAFCRGGSTSGGLNLGTANELRYHWGAGSNPSYNFNSGLTLPDATWTFVSLVISPTQATIYMKPAGGSLQSATATGTFSAQSFSDTFYLGYDPNSTARRFKGDMDDFRVFRRSLSLAEITALANDGGTPSTPSPAVDGTKVAGIGFNATWSPAPSSTSYQIYLGTTYAGVRDATTASPEYEGSSTSASLSPGTLAPGKWFWRVDASDGTTVLKGPVWHFNIVTDPAGLTGWWKMNDGAGSTAADSSGSAANGAITGGAWGSGKRSGALVFDGNDKMACGTNASLNGTTPFSVSAWVKIPASHAAQAIVIQQRGPADASTNGYNGQYQLRINADGKPSFWVYGNGANQWDFTASTAVHDDQWHHLLAVRDGTEGRIYIDGTLAGSASGTVRSLVSNIPVYMGCDGRDNNRFLSGSLDEVRIYNRALSGDEIQALLNRTPCFTGDPVTGAAASEAVAYSGTLAGSAADYDTAAGETLTFSKLSGPSWLSVASNGTLSGTPLNPNAGLNTFSVRVTDAAGTSGDATLQVTVGPPPPGNDYDSDGYADQLELALGTNPYSSGSQPGSIYSGLKSWWRLNESSGTSASDSSGYQRAGAVSGAAWATGKNGNALQFDGVNDTVLVGNSAALTGTTDFTLGAWVKVNSGSALGTVIQQREPGASGYLGEYMLNVNANGTVNFFVYGSGGYQFDLTTTTTVNDGQWHYLSGVRSGTTGYLYIDGVQAATASGTIQSLNALAVSIGYDYRDTNKHFTGLIDDVRIYSRALSGAEVLSIYDPLALPAGWTKQDIGSTGVAGSATHSAGSYTVNGSGADIWGTADAFHYVWQSLSGDGEITARVASVENTNAWAKAGVMIRESLTAGSKHAMIVVTPGSGVSFQRRATAGGSSTSTTTTGITAPRWVRITRSGNTLTTYHSANGSSWTTLGSESITMASNIQIGLAVTSHNNATDCTAVFDNVTVTP